MKRQNLDAFSLVELSIVLVILGLLTGGVLTGQHLIHAAELRKITQDLTTIQGGISVFRDKYFALPGDMTNATAFWPAADGNDGINNDCRDVTSDGSQTCNGDGNGQIHHSDGAGNGMEWFHAWIHLQNAGLYNVGTDLTGTRIAAPRRGEGGVNLPEGALGAGGGYTLMSFRVDTGEGINEWYRGNYDQMVQYGANLCNIEPTGPVVSPGDLFHIDTKLDDGKPGTGFVRTRHDVPGCVAPTGIDNWATAGYRLQIETIECNIIHS